MPRPIDMVRHCCAASATAVALSVQAAEEPSGTTFSAEVGVGAEYDSNVSVDELDLASSQSDYALIVDAEFKLEQRLSDATDLTISYDFTQANYDEFSLVDRQTHLLGADIGSSFGKVNGGLTLYYINARLDGDAFLEYYRGSPYLSGFLSKKWFARGAYVYSDKRIEENTGRDATSHAGEFDLYFFRRGLRSYFNIGFKYKDEDAMQARYDHVSSNLKLRYIHRFDLWNDVLKLELSWRYEDRDYSGVTPSIGAKRSDERHRWKIDLEYPVLGSGAVQLYAGYADYQSNYPLADYDQHVVGTRLSWAW